MLHQALDRAALAGGIPALEQDQYRDFLLVRFIMHFMQFFAKAVHRFLIVIRFPFLEHRHPVQNRGAVFLSGFRQLSRRFEDRLLFQPGQLLLERLGNRFTDFYGGEPPVHRRYRNPGTAVSVSLAESLFDDFNIFIIFAMPPPLHFTDTPAGGRVLLQFFHPLFLFFAGDVQKELD